MKKKIESFKVRVNSEQAKIVRDRMSACGVTDKVSDEYGFERDRDRDSCISYSNINNTIVDYFDVRLISFPEISFEDFLNMFPETMEGRKIIGYKLKPKFENLRDRISGLLNNTVLKNKNVRADFGVGSIMHNRTKELQVLNIWLDPVYEEEKPEKKAFTIGFSTVIAEKGSGKVTSEGTTHSIEELKDSVMEMESRVKKETKGIEELREVIKFIQK